MDDFVGTNTLFPVNQPSDATDVAAHHPQQVAFTSFSVEAFHSQAAYAAQQSTAEKGDLHLPLSRENMFHSRELFLRGWSAAEAKLQRAAEHFIPSSSESDDGHESSDPDTETTERKQSMEERGGAGRPAAMHEHRGKEKRRRNKCALFRLIQAVYWLFFINREPVLT